MTAHAGPAASSCMSMPKKWKWSKPLLNDINVPAEKGFKREPLRIGAGGGPDNRFHGSIDEVRVYNRALSAAEIGIVAEATPVNEISAIAEGQRSPAQAAKIRD